MPAFYRLWGGQTLSVCGSKMTQFSMSLWLFGETGLASALALLFAAGAIGSLIAQASAGLIVDRYSRKTVMICCDVAASCLSIVLLVLAASDSLQHWHLFVLTALTSPLAAMQGIAYRASVATMLPKEELRRGASLATLTHYGTNIIGPAFAAVVYPAFGLFGVIAVDLASFLVAMATIATVSIPLVTAEQDSGSALNIKNSEAILDDDGDDNGKPCAANSGWLGNFKQGFECIRNDPRLKALLYFQMAFMACHEMTNALWQPLILARSGNDAVVAAGVAMASGISGVVVAVLLSVWNGPKQTMRAFLYASLGAGVAKTLFGMSNNSLQWQVTQALSSASFPVRSAAYNTVWMSLVPQHRQGQVFGVSGFCVQICMYTSFLVTALFADYVLQPWLDGNPGVLGGFSAFTGDGAGAGFALLFIVGGLGMTVVSGVGFLTNSLRDQEAGKNARHVNSTGSLNR